MNTIQGLIQSINAISNFMARVCKWLVLLLSFIICYEIFCRYVLNNPTKWCFDLSYMIGGTFFLMGEAWTLRKRQHVRIDIFYNRFSKKTRARIDIVLLCIFFFPLWGGLLYALIPYVAFSWEMGERSMQGYWQPIIYPFNKFMPLGVGLLLLQGVAELLRNFTIAFGGGKQHES